MKTTLPLEVIRALPDNYPKEDFVRDLAGNRKILDVMENVLKNKITKIHDTKETDYDSPSWANKQAHQNGKVEAYQDVIKLFLGPNGVIEKDERPKLK